MSGERTLAVVYDRGAASVTELAASLDGVADLAYLVPDNEHTAPLRPVMAELGRVLPLSGDPRRDAEAVARLAPDGIVTFSEYAIRSTARLAAALGLPYHDRQAALLLTDKFRQRDRLAAAGVDRVRCVRVSRAEDWWPALSEVGLPAVVKPVRGGASRDTHLIADERSAAERFAERFGAEPAGGGPDGAVVVEEFLAGRPAAPYGDYVSVESMCCAGEIRHLQLTGKFALAPPFRETGHFTPPALPPAEHAAVLRLTTGALRALGVRTGLTHTEIKLTVAGPRIIEVNGRLGGRMAELAGRAYGVDLVRIGCLLALGEALPPEPAEPAGVHFSYHCPGPAEACRLEAVHGAWAVRRLPGVLSYQLLDLPGQDLPDGVATYAFDLIRGQAADHRAMLDTMRAALGALTIEFSFPDGRRVTSRPGLVPTAGVPV